MRPTPLPPALQQALTRARLPDTPPSPSLERRVLVAYRHSLTTAASGNTTADATTLRLALLGAALILLLTTALSFTSLTTAPDPSILVANLALRDAVDP